MMEDEFKEFVQRVTVLEEEVSRRKKLEEELRASEEWYETLAEVSPVGIFRTDAEGRCLYVNSRWCAIGGLTPEEARGHGWIQALHPEDRERVTSEWYEAAREDKPFHSEYRFRTPGGRTTWVIGNAAAVRTADGELRGYVGTLTDITERKKAEAARREQLEQFAHTVSHALKTPLITVRGFLGLLERRLDDGDREKLRAYIAQAQEAADRMFSRLSELLELSRTERLVDPRDGVAFAELAGEAARMAKGQLAKRRARVEIDDDLPAVRCDAARIRAVLEILLDNAAKFMGDEPRPLVRIGARRAGKEIVFFVQDNGCGIDPRDQEKVFSLYTRLHDDVEGTGAGLYIAKQVIEAHGGRIWVESAGTGKGSTFCFTLGPGCSQP